jgi:hypothetical protein
MERFPAIALLKKRESRGKRALPKCAHSGIDGLKVKRRSVNHQIGGQPFWEKFIGHIIFMNAFAGSLCPAGEATDAIPDGLFAQIHDFNIGACLTHTVYQGIEHHCGIAISLAAGAGIQCKDFHTDLLCFLMNQPVVFGNSQLAKDIIDY